MQENQSREKKNKSLAKLEQSISVDSGNLNTHQQELHSPNEYDNTDLCDCAGIQWQNTVWHKEILKLLDSYRLSPKGNSINTDFLTEYIEPEWSGLYPATISAAERGDLDSQSRDIGKIFDPSAIDFATLMQNASCRLAEETVPIHVRYVHIGRAGLYNLIMCIP